MNSPSNDRLLTLDAMRGLAAIVVMLSHSFGRFHGHGYLAVDFFFLLSGFVLARAYQARLNAGMTFSSFAVLRVIRLYPLYLVGLMIGLGAQLLFGVGQFYSGHQLPISAVFNAVLLPSPATAGFLFPLNPPAWSLFLELAVNLLFAGALAKSGMRMLVAVVTVSGSLLLWWGIARGDLNVGPTWNTLLLGVVRTIFGFTAGVVIARSHVAVNRESWISVALMTMLVVVLVIPMAWHGYDLLVSMVVAPALVWFGARFAPPRLARKASEVLGDISFALYATHGPLVGLFALAAKQLNVNGSVWLPVFFAFMLTGSWLIHRFWDEPLRRRLSAAWKMRQIVFRPSLRNPVPNPSYSFCRSPRRTTAERFGGVSPVAPTPGRVRTVENQ